MEQNLLQLDNRIVVVSGAGGGGLGTTVTRMAARAGATISELSAALRPSAAPVEIAPLPVSRDEDLVRIPFIELCSSQRTA